MVCFWSFTQIRTVLASLTPARTVSYQFDDEGRMASMTDSTFATATTYQYDDQGRTTQIINDQGIINYGYNDLGQKIRTWTSTDATGTDAVTDTRYSYDNLGRLATVEVFERFNAYAPGSEPNTSEDTTTYYYDVLGNLDYMVQEDVGGSSITTDYTYDSLNRLDLLVHFVDSNSNGIYDEATETMVASFDYTLDLAGNRISATETVDSHAYQWTWTYDELNRLSSESLDATTPGDDALDYTDTFTYDLTGNRLSQVHTTLSETTNTVYFYDANDRLLAEVKDNTSDNTQDRYTEYQYNNTTQSSKTVYEGTDATGIIQSSISYTYNAMGRLATTAETTYTAGIDPQTKTTEYEYNTQGLRVVETVTAADSTVTTKKYLFDTQNPTGYAQVLEEYINDQLAYSFTLGHDVISQAKAVGIPANGSGDLAAAVYQILTDGHGSTRLLANLNATVIAIAQQYLYSAYGEMLTAAHLADATTALTSLLYSGEWTNPNGTQYLRARFYDPATGRFNRADDFAGNQNDPQSLHKYLYTNSNPIMGVDPSGEFLVQVLTSISIGSLMVGFVGAGLYAVNRSAGYGLDGYDLIDSKQPYMAIIIREARKNRLSPAFLTAILDAELSDIDNYDRYGDFLGAAINIDTSVGIGQLNISTIRLLRPGSGTVKAMLLGRDPTSNIALTAQYLRLIASSAKKLAIDNGLGINASNVDDVEIRTGLVGVKLKDFDRDGIEWSESMIEIMGYNYTQAAWWLVPIGSNPNWYRLAQLPSDVGSYGEYVREKYEFYKPLFQ